MGGEKVYPMEANKLLNSLTQEQINILKQDYPFKYERNSLIYDLAARGVKYPVLAKITGMSKSTVHRIGMLGINGPGYACSHKELSAATMKRVRTAFDAFYREIEKILTTGG